MRPTDYWDLPSPAEYQDLPTFATDFLDNDHPVVPAACPGCGWDAYGHLRLVDRYTTDRPPIPWCDLREVIADSEDGPVAFCPACDGDLDPDVVLAVSGMSRAVTLPLVARTAYQNSRCSLCDIIIIGYHGARPYLEILDRMLRVEVEPAHPIDEIDEIVRVDGAWVHADCAETAGREVRR